MKCPVYRSLDKPSAFFGLRGRFMTWTGVLMAVVLVIAFVVGMLTVSWLGFLVFAVGAVASYLLVMNLQGKSSDRAFSTKMNSKRYPQYLRTPPGAFRHMWEDM